MRSYRLRQLLEWGFRLFVCLIVLVQSTTWVPIAVKSTIHFFRDLISIFNCHFYIFILFNAIIFLVYSFSSLYPTATATANDNNKQQKTSTDLYDEFVINSTYGRRFYAGNKSPVPVNSFEDKPMVCSENAVSSPAMSNQKYLKKSGDSVSFENRGSVVKNKTLVVKCYRRTQSESYKRCESEKLRRDFRRSNKTKHRNLKLSKAEATVDGTSKHQGLKPSKAEATVDAMSNDEFNQTIEAFIVAQKLIQREEYREERKTVWFGSPTILTERKS